MPKFSLFWANLLQMFREDHAPPRFRVRYAGFKARIDIATLEVVSGELPRCALGLVLDWAQEHRAELKEDWYLCSRNHPPMKIEPFT